MYKSVSCDETVLFIHITQGKEVTLWSELKTKITDRFRVKQKAN